MHFKKNNKISFGIMCDSMYLFGWQSKLIHKLLAKKEISCELLIINDNRQGNTNLTNNKIISFIKKTHLKNYFWHIYRYFFVRTSSNEKIDMSSYIKNVKKIHCKTFKKGKFSEYFTNSDINEIKNQHLDFILRFSYGIIRGKILDSAKYGIWSFHHDDEKKYRGGPPCFWEIYYNDNSTGSILQRLTNKLDSGIILKKGFLKTQNSYMKNLQQMHYESSNWPLQLCNDILNGKIEVFNAKPSNTQANIYKAPSNFQLIKFLLKSNYRKLKNILNKLLFIDQWNIGIADKSIETYLNYNEQPNINWFPYISSNSFYADPFVITEQDKLHIFYEDYTYSEKKGKISYSCYENKSFSYPKIVLNESFHLSYPFIIKDNEDIYMIPETYEARKVILYRAKKFPLVWEKEKILIDDYPGVDTTVIRFKGIWWMFSTNHDNGNHKLDLFYANNIKDEWTPHPCNPVKIDISSSRSAGTPFIHQNELYRPSMNYSEKVEGSITINKIINISKTNYNEIIFNEIKPYSKTQFSDKTHHLAKAGNYTAIDGCKESFIYTNINFIKFFFSRLIKKLNSIYN